MSTSKPKVTISPAHERDLDRLGDIQRLAFADSAIDQLIFGKCTTEALIKGNANRYRKALKDPHSTVYKATDGDGKLIGIALWGLPHPFDEKEHDKIKNETPEEKRKRMLEMHPEGTDLELVQFFSQFDFGVRDPHWHLHILCVDPTVQNSGAGSALLRWGLQQADRDGVDTYLEASIPAVPLYERYGFHKWQKAGYGGPNNEMALQPMRRRPLRIKQATEEQIPLLAKLHRDAFLPTAWYQSLWGQVEETVFLDWMETEIKDWLKRGPNEQVVVAMIGEDQIVGYAHWQQMDHEMQVNGHANNAHDGNESTKVAPQSYPEGTSVERWTAFTREMDAFVDSIPGKFWHLHILATSGAKLKAGAGRSLVYWGARQAQKQGLPVHLEGGNEAMSFYHKLGFKQCGPPVKGICGTFADTPLKLEPLMVGTPTADELPRLSEIHLAAFWTSPLNLPMFKNTTREAYNEWNMRRIRFWTDPVRHDKTHFVRVVRRGQDGIIVAYAHWDLNEGDGGELDSAEDTKTWPEGTDTEVAELWYGAMLEQGKKIKGRHLMLHQLAVDPSFERLGAGRMLLQFGIDELVGQHKVPMHLDATREGLALYERMGFKRWDDDLCPDGNEAAAVVPMKLEPTR
ncbi:hypothetical protein OIV83_005953 [Microbotryomycetes sp. JL201]|nr:hypothetical protein OIV83_005953 [Microbotryomycetes sp. JL201]